MIFVGSRKKHYCIQLKKYGRDNLHTIQFNHSETILGFVHLERILLLLFATNNKIIAYFQTGSILTR